MKAFCFILSLYVLLLSAVPCCAEDDCANEKKTEQAENRSQEQENHDCSNCSPFMNCGTCVGFTFNALEPLVFKQTALLMKETQSFITTDSHFLSGFSSKIWQPPRLV